MRINKTIVHIAYEVAPYFKQGGLGDVLSALPNHLAQKYNNIVISFYYKGLMNQLNNYSTGFLDIQINGMDYVYKYYHLRRNNVYYYFLNMEDEYIFANNGINQLNGENPYKNHSPVLLFIYLGKAILKLIQNNLPTIDYIICHDWHGCGIFCYSNTLESIKSLSKKKITTSILIHNYDHQGKISEDIFPYLEYEPYHTLNKIYLKFNSVTLLGLSIQKADSILTVSKGYAEELNNAKLPHENLKFILKSNKTVQGLQNGVDYTIWHPKKSPYLDIKYNINSFNLKNKHKNEVFKKYNLNCNNICNTPLLLYMNRLTEQKGVNLLFDAFRNDQTHAITFYRNLFKLNCKFIILGNPSGGISGKIAQSLYHFVEIFPNSFHYDPNYNESNAHKLLAAADMVLIPSFFEPCGLVQLYAMAFGTIPLVRPVGGLKDSVRSVKNNEKSPTGFYINSFSREALYGTIKNAINIFRNYPDKWNNIVLTAMQENFSWEKKVKQYFDFLNHSQVSQNIDV